jgi:hypothetical protein
MTNAQQLAANRRNAQRSTGPRTGPGKAIARLNAVKHGGLATTPVVPQIEQPAAWERHLAATLASLQPAGHLETMLAGRVALLLWRLERVARYEREVITLTQEEVEDDLADKRRYSSQAIGGLRLADVQDKLDAAQECVGVFERFVKLDDDAPVTGEAAELILSAVSEQTENVDPEDFSMPDVVPDEVPWEDYTGWTASLVRGGVAAMAVEEGVDATRLWDRTLVKAYLQVNLFKREVERVLCDLDRLRRERLLPATDKLDKLTRYEAHLSRQLGQALHELQRLQAARSGETVPPPAVLDVTVSGLE